MDRIGLGIRTRTWALMVPMALLLAGCGSPASLPLRSASHAPLPSPFDIVPAQGTVQPSRSSVVSQRWLDWHRQWEGTPHRLGGEGPQGIDCSAYVQQGYRELFGIRLPRTAKALIQKGQEVDMRDLRAGDLVFFDTGSAPGHVGVYLGDGTFTHVSSSKGVLRSRLSNPYWRRHYLDARRVF